MQSRMNFVLVALAVVALLVGTAGVAQADLIAHWTFDEIEGTTAYDETAGNHDGTIDTAHVTVNQSGKIGKAYLFDGALNGPAGAGGVTVPHDTALDGFTTATFCQWVYMTEGPGGKTMRIMSKEAGTAPAVNWGTRMDSANPGRFYSIIGRAPWSSAVAVDSSADYLNNWHQFTVTYVDNTGTGGNRVGKLYVDGVLLDTDTRTSSGIAGNTAPLYLGTGSDTGTDRANFNGKLDDLGIWNECLDAINDGKIKSLFNVVGVSGLEAYNQSYMKKLFDVYDAGSGSTTTDDGLVWEYTATTPGTHANGDVWIEGGYYYVKLGSGVKAEIPEPSTLLLLTTGLLGLLAYAWRKRK